MRPINPLRHPLPRGARPEAARRRALLPTQRAAARLRRIRRSLGRGGAVVPCRYESVTGVTPTVGPEACAVGAIDLTRRFAPLLSRLRWPAVGSGARGWSCPSCRSGTTRPSPTPPPRKSATAASSPIRKWSRCSSTTSSSCPEAASGPSWTTSACSGATGGSGWPTCRLPSGGGTATPTRSSRWMPHGARCRIWPTSSSYCGPRRAISAASQQPTRSSVSSADVVIRSACPGP